LVDTKQSGVGVAYPEYEKASGRVISKRNQVLGESVVVAAQFTLPVQLVKLVWNWLEALGKQPLCGAYPVFGHVYVQILLATDSELDHFAGAGKMMLVWIPRFFTARYDALAGQLKAPLTVAEQGFAGHRHSGIRCHGR